MSVYDPLTPQEVRRHLHSCSVCAQEFWSTDLSGAVASMWDAPAGGLSMNACCASTQGPQICSCCDSKISSFGVAVEPGVADADVRARL